MSKLMCRALPLTGLHVVERQTVGDARGHLTRLFCADDLSHAGWSKPIVQINHTYTAQHGTVRGMHYQTPPYAEMKLVTCIRGEAWDVAVDIRKGSPTLLQYHAERISAENRLAMLIPEGFAHGFQAMTDDVELMYCHTALYAPGAEGGLHVLDSRLDIDWPLPVSNLSQRDSAHPFIQSGFDGVQT